MPLSDKIFHDVLKLPYRLHIRYKRIKNPVGTTYILLHGLADTGELWAPLLPVLPKNTNYIVVDLLGHGKSKHPSITNFYSAYRQAINVRFTYATLGLTGPVVLIGHSFGSLVATEFAYHYKRISKRLILCAPPVYREPLSKRTIALRQESILRELYRQILKQPKAVSLSYDIANKLNLLGFSKTNLNADNFIGFESTLRAGIMNQYAEKHLGDVKIPVTIIYGVTDPFIVSKNFTKLATINPHIAIKTLLGGHAVRKNTLKAIVDAIEK